MKNITYLFLAFLLVCNSANAQNSDKQKAEKYLETKGEVCFKFKAESEQQFKEIISFLSIGHKPVSRESLEVEAYANTKTFEKFLTYGLDYTVNKEDNELTFDPHKSSSSKMMAAWDTTWDAYPTYSQYTAKMAYYAATYPTICSLENIGTTENGRDLLMLKISDNVSTNEAEPEFMYTSSMHGNELTGYPLMIRLIDYLLTNYGSNTEVDNIVNSTVIYINPLANPDGCYGNVGSNTISSPTRENANGQDLNRNYPDNQNIGRINGNSGNTSRLHYDSTGNVYENETIAFMNFEESHNIVLSANFHGGTDVVNYPYDNTYTKHADHDYYEHISAEYAVNCQTNSPAGYMTTEYDFPENPSSPGVTQGSVWYVVYGGRQDYMNYFRHSKEVTVEISNTKQVSGSQLPNYWNYNLQAFLDYMKQVNYGFQGIVSDESGNPIATKISIAGHDALNSYIFSNEDFGDYYRLIKGGTYTVTYEADGYTTQNISVTVTDDTQTIQNVTMVATTAQPTASDAIINSGETAALSATGTGTIKWYQNINDTSPVYTGANYTTPTLNADTSYFVEDAIVKANVGSTDNTVNGGFFAGGSSERYLVFDCTEPVKLTEVTVNAEQAGEIEVQLQNSSGTMLDSRVIIVESAGIQQITLDFIIPIGTDMRLTSIEMTSGFRLYRNNSGVSYPYTNGSISIKDSNAGTGFYYFFYDWAIQDIKSSRKQVDVTVNHPLDIDDNILSNIGVYPNPFKNTIDIKLPNNYNNEDIELILYDISSRVINSSYSIINQGHLKINALDKLSIGTYFLKIFDTNSGENTIRKLIKE